MSSALKSKPRPSQPASQVCWVSNKRHVYFSASVSVLTWENEVEWMVGGVTRRYIRMVTGCWLPASAPAPAPVMPAILSRHPPPAKLMSK